MILDTNVIIDVLENNLSDPFLENVGQLVAENVAFMNEIVFAEVAGRFASAEAAIERLERLGLRMQRLSLDDCHRASIAFCSYRREGRARTAILPDFLIGAQAEGRGWPLVTRDRKGFAKYFPEVELIDPYEGMS